MAAYRFLPSHFTYKTRLFRVTEEYYERSTSAGGGNNTGSNSNERPTSSFYSPSVATATVEPGEDCRTFLIVGGVLGSLLVLASAMMCVLSHRLYKLSRRYKKEKLDAVVRDHR